ncbi:MAG: hypothetical protein P8188_03295 [Gemmatimonadota bacterium]
MVHIRATAKVLRSLPLSKSTDAPPDSALGDWYANRLVIDRIPVLLLISSASLLPILLRARGVRSLPEILPAIVRARLHRLGIPAALIEAEVAAMDPVHVAKTRDRSVLGVLVDFGRMLPHYLPHDWNEGDFVDAEAKLQTTPFFCSRRAREVVFPDRDTRALLESR